MNDILLNLDLFACVWLILLFLIVDQDPIKQPMIQTRDKQLKKEAVEIFKYIL